MDKVICIGSSLYEIQGDAPTSGCVLTGDQRSAVHMDYITHFSTKGSVVTDGQRSTAQTDYVTNSDDNKVVIDPVPGETGNVGQSLLGQSSAVLCDIDIDAHVLRKHVPDSVHDGGAVLDSLAHGNLISFDSSDQQLRPNADLGCYTTCPSIVPCDINVRLEPRHYVGGSKSQMNVHSWNYYLNSESDSIKRSYLADGIMNGFRIVDDNANIDPYECPNYGSVLHSDAFEFVDNLIRSELSDEKFVFSEFSPHCVHSLGAIPKQDGGFRPITDCSKPYGISINNFMEDTFHTFNYVTLDQVSANVTPNCFMATVDISAAYRSISIREDNWKYQGISWPLYGDQVYLFDVRLSFGLRCAPYIFTELSDFVVRTMEKLGYLKVANYLDDFLVFGESFEACQQAQLALISLLGDLGFIVSWKKCSSPSKCVRYLGILIDSVEMSLSLPPDKLLKLRNELEFFQYRNRATKRQIQRLCGIVAHCAKVVRGGRTFSRRLIDLLAGLKDGNPRIHLNEEFKNDIEWWISFAEVFNGKEDIIFPNTGEGPSFASDSCLNGYGFISGSDWQAGYFNSQDLPRNVECCIAGHNHWVNVDVNDQDNINYLELIPVWLALIRYGASWRNSHVLCISDNTQVVHVLRKGHSANKDCMDLLRRIFWICVTNNIYVTTKHISGDSNIIPDRLSRVCESQDLTNILSYSICCSGCQ